MRSLFVRSLQSVLALATVALLTGANDAGCGLGTVISGGGSGGSGDTTVGSGPMTPPDPGSCPGGQVLKLVCDPSPSGGGGIIPIGTCDGPDCPTKPEPLPCDPADPNCTSPSPGTPDQDGPPPPPKDGGTPTPEPVPCNPADPNCTPPTPGTPDQDGPPPCDPATPGCTPPPAQDGGTPPPPPPPPPGCSYQCVPVDPNCPPGTYALTVCTSPGDPGNDDGGEIPPSDPNTPVSNEGCWTECVPHGCGGETPGAPPQPGLPPKPVPQPGEPLPD